MHVHPRPQKPNELPSFAIHASEPVEHPYEKIGIVCNIAAIYSLNTSFSFFTLLFLNLRHSPPKAACACRSRSFPSSNIYLPRIDTFVTNIPYRH